MALKPSAVPGTIISFSPFIWADRLLRHKVLNHARKPRVSVTPACCSEARTCACWLPRRRQRVRESPNQWLWAWAGHSAVGGWFARLLSQRTLAYLPLLLNAGCSEVPALRMCSVGRALGV